MSKTRSDEIRRFILNNAPENSRAIVALTAEHFGITRQAVNKHIRVLLDEKKLKCEGTTKSRQYSLMEEHWGKTYLLDGKLNEETVWSEIKPLLSGLPVNVRNIWNYGITEMVNNAIDHSEGTKVEVLVAKTAINTKCFISDNGVGIFKKIKNALNLDEESHAVLELGKGKLTTDPQRHSGEGVFFTSRSFDQTFIASEKICFAHRGDEKEDYVLEPETEVKGTRVSLELSNDSQRQIKDVFDQYTSDDGEYGFTKTVIPVRLAQYGDETLISRSQAKRLLMRFEKFKVVVLDFSGVHEIGQAFADEIFRVYRNAHPETEISHTNACDQVDKMIRRAETHDSV